MAETVARRGACSILPQSEPLDIYLLPGAALPAQTQRVDWSLRVNSPVSSQLLDGKVWDGRYDMAYAPVWSADGAHLALAVEKAGRQTIVVDGKAYPQSFDKCYAPAFSPDGKLVLIRALAGGKCHRIVAPVTAFTG